MTVSYAATLVSRTMLANPLLAPLFAEVCSILPTELSWSQRLFEPGQVEITTQLSALDPVCKPRLLNLSTYPCELWLYRSDSSTGVTQKVHAGPVTAWRIQDRAITLTSPDLLYYLNYIRLPLDVDLNVDQSAIIIYLMQDGSSSGVYHNFGVDDQGVNTTGTVVSVSYKGAEMTPILDAMQTLGRSVTGFDLAVDSVTRSLTTYVPQRGVDRSADVVIDRRSIGLADISVSVAAGQFATRVFSSTSTAATGTLTTFQTNSTALQSFGMAIATVQPDNISSQTDLDNLATAVVRDMSTPQFTLNPEVLPVYGFDPVSIRPGDTVGYSYDAGLGTQNLTPRIASIDTTWDGRERMSLGFV